MADTETPVIEDTGDDFGPYPAEVESAEAAPAPDEPPAIAQEREEPAEVAPAPVPVPAEAPFDLAAALGQIAGLPAEVAPVAAPNPELAEVRRLIAEMRAGQQAPAPRPMAAPVAAPASNDTTTPYTINDVENAALTEVQRQFGRCPDPNTSPEAAEMWNRAYAGAYRRYEAHAQEHNGRLTMREHMTGALSPFEQKITALEARLEAASYVAPTDPASVRDALTKRLTEARQRGQQPTQAEIGQWVQAERIAHKRTRIAALLSGLDEVPEVKAAVIATLRKSHGKRPNPVPTADPRGSAAAPAPRRPKEPDLNDPGFSDWLMNQVARGRTDN